MYLIASTVGNRGHVSLQIDSLILKALVISAVLGCSVAHCLLKVTNATKVKCTF